MILMGSTSLSGRRPILAFVSSNSVKPNASMAAHAF
jgi:hypothetical protein